MPSTRQTLTALSQSSRQTVASLLLSQRGPELEGAEPAGQSGAGARHTRSGLGPRRQFRAAPHVRCGSGLLDRVARTGGRSGVCPGLRFCSGPRVGGGFGTPPRTTLSRQGSSELDPGVTLHTDPNSSPGADPSRPGLALPTPCPPRPPGRPQGGFWGNCSPDQHSCCPPRAW